jgi:hypothetical protein
MGTLSGWLFCSMNLEGGSRNKVDQGPDWQGDIQATAGSELGVKGDRR